MTKYQRPNPEAILHTSRLTGFSNVHYDDVREFMKSLEAEGLLADTGKKRFRVDAAALASTRAGERRREV